MTHIIFPIGDWSCDGHSCYADFLVKSDKPLSEVRQTHLKENDFIGSLCEDYRDNKIEVYTLYEFLIKYIPKTEAQEKIKYLIANGIELTDDVLEVQETACRLKNTEMDYQVDYQVQLSFEDDENCQALVIEEPKHMLDVWLMCLNTIEPSLNLVPISEAMSQYFIKYKGYPTKPEGNINFYGFNEQNQHLQTPGYGIWDDHSGEFFHDVN
jgi:hypothetical protein